MRGRTNVTQRATPYVNGEVITAEVETGSVNAGDFVEYKTVNSSGTYMDEELGQVCSQFYYGDYYLVHTYKNSNTYLQLYNNSGELLNNLIINSSQGMLNELDDNLFVYSGGSGKILLNIKDNVINILDEFTGGTENCVSLLNKTEKTFVVFSHENSQVECFIYSYNDNKITYLRKVTSTDSNFFALAGYNSLGYYSKFLKYLEDDKLAYVYYASGRYSSSSSGKWRYATKVILLHFEDNESQIVVDLSTDDSDVNIENDALGRTIKNVGKNIFAIQSNYVSNGIYNLKFYVYSNDTLSLLAKYQITNINSDFDSDYIGGSSSTYNYYPGISSPFENILILFGCFHLKSLSDRRICQVVFEYDKDKNSITISNSLVLGYDLIRMYDSFSIKNGNSLQLYYDQYTSKTYYFNAVYQNGILSKYVNTNYVKQYTGENAIGFAKTSGNQGEEVRIYIPKVS